MAAFSLRPARLADALAMAGVHRLAVQALVGGPYPRDVLDHWAPPVTLTRAEQLFREEQDDGADTIVAASNDDVLGFGVVALRHSELRACYVAPASAGLGIGRALVTALEEIARSNRCAGLAVRAPVNAIGFYATLGYLETRRAVFRFEDGVDMAVALMRKPL